MTLYYRQEIVGEDWRFAYTWKALACSYQFTKKEGFGPHKTSLTPPLFIELHVLS
jgi:hypothetical protein